MNNIFKLIISILICEGAGIFGSLFTMSQIKSWYADIKKPSFNPPDWIFGPVWSFLFLLMGVSLYLVWSGGISGISIKTEIIIFVIQLALNILWSILFFGIHSPKLAFVDIVFLWAMILLTVFEFYSINNTAGLLLIPYFLWVSFALILNFEIWKLN